MKEKAPIKVPAPPKRNPLAVPAKTRPGAGKHGEGKKPRQPKHPNREDDL